MLRSLALAEKKYVDQIYNPFLVGCAVGTSIMFVVVMAMHVLIN